MVGMSLNAPGHIAPLVIGLGLGALIWLGGPLSGGHFNPALSIAAALGGSLTFLRAFLYIIAQLAGACAGGFVADRVFDKHFMPTPGTAGLNAALAAEFLFTFLYIVVALRTGRSPSDMFRRGAAVGAVVAVATHSCLAVSGATFNPALLAGAWCSQVGAPAANLFYFAAVQAIAATAAALGGDVAKLVRARAGRQQGVDTTSVATASGMQLVGRVVTVDDRTCDVMLFTAKGAEAVSAMIFIDATANGLVCRLSPTGTGTLKGPVDDRRDGAGQAVEPAIGQVVRLNDGRWASCAQMLLIGKVTAVEPSPEGPLRKIVTVTPTIERLDRVSEVIIRTSASSMDDGGNSKEKAGSKR
jgi:aquaporin Z